MRLLVLACLLFWTISYLGKCPDSDERCQSCKGETCVYCVYSFSDADGVCRLPLKPVANCYSYVKDGVCGQCEFGYFRSIKGICMKLTSKNTENCFFSVISVSSCSHCLDRSLTMNGKCPTRRKCKDPNCAVCFMWGTTEACFYCGEGHFLVGEDYKPAVCKQTTTPTLGCYYSNSTDYCLDCDIGFIFNNYTCLASNLTTMTSARVLALALITVGLLLLK